MQELEPNDDDALRLSMDPRGVWATWPGSNSNVLLGPTDVVCREMRRFLASIEIGTCEE